MAFGPSFSKMRNTYKAAQFIDDRFLNDKIVYYLSYLSYLMGENGKIPIIVSTYLPFMILILVSLIGIVRLNEK